jgi:hypothetical protein
VLGARSIDGLDGRTQPFDHLLQRARLADIAGEDPAASGMRGDTVIDEPIFRLFDGPSGEVKTPA